MAIGEEWRGEEIVAREGRMSARNMDGKRDGQESAQVELAPGLPIPAAAKVDEQ